MAPIHRLSFLLAALIWLTACAALDQPSENSLKPAVEPKRMPLNDEWYRPPKDFHKEPAGTILKFRRAPQGITLNNKDKLRVKDTWQILYRTINSVGEPDATVVTLAVPNNANPKNIFMYHWFSDAGYGDCNPSSAMGIGTREDNRYTQLQSAIMVLALSQGWMTAVVDDGGLWGVFASGRGAAYKNLDAMRALRKSTSFTTIPSNAKLVTYGYSGGAFGGEWLAELQPTYAPDVKIDGVALGGLLPNLTHLLTWDKNNRTAYMPPALIGLSRDYKNITTWLDEALKPDKKDHFWKSATQCYDTNWDDFAGEKVEDFFIRGLEALKETVPKSVFESASIMGNGGTPKVPMYIYETVGDDTSPVELADNLIKKHCANGANIMYERTPKILNHSSEMVQGLPGAIRWVIDRFEGKTPAPGCKTLDESAESTLAARQGLTFTALLGIGLSFLGMPIGPNYLTNWITKFPN